MEASPRDTAPSTEHGTADHGGPEPDGGALSPDGPDETPDGVSDGPAPAEMYGAEVEVELRPQQPAADLAARAHRVPGRARLPDVCLPARLRLRRQRRRDRDAGTADLLLRGQAGA